MRLPHAILALSIVVSPYPLRTARAQTAPPGPLPVRPDSATADIKAVVNGDVISRGDVDNRRKLFALSSGLPPSQDVLNRLSPRILQQLIEERLRLQEMQRRHIVVSDAEIAKSIQDVEQRNGMAAGLLASRLGAQGVELRTLIDQIRVQLGWTRVLRQQLGGQSDVSEADIAAQVEALKAQIGQTEYRVAEIFVPFDAPRATADTQKFVDTIIQELRAGAPFPVAAAQFSQSQTALQGGDLGWVQQGQLDPEVLRIVSGMPVGAISNPIRVPSGYSIMTLRGKRQVGQTSENVVVVRQAFLSFTTALDPRAPTAQQKEALLSAKALSASAHDCAGIEAANTRFGGTRPSDPGPVQLETLPPAMRSVLEQLQPLRASQPLVSQDGIVVVMVCSPRGRAETLPSRAEITDRILAERVELGSRQLMRDLQRRALIEQRG